MLSIFIYCGKLFHRSVNLQNEIIKCALYTDLKDELTCKKKKKRNIQKELDGVNILFDACRGTKNIQNC